MVMAAVAEVMPAAGSTPGLGVDLLRMAASIPIERMVGFSGGTVSRAQLDELLAAINSQR
jgi:beta-glucosidase